MMIWCFRMAAFIGACLYAAAGFAALELSPAGIEFRAVSQSNSVVVLHDGKALSPADIRKVATGIFKSGEGLPAWSRGGTHFSDYSYMFAIIINTDGSITLTPKEGQLEAGTYDLLVETTYGTATGSIDANLRDSIAVAPVRRVEYRILSYEFKLPDYSQGQTVAIDLKPDQSNTYYWYVDGELHSSGLGLTSFRLTPTPGDHEISFQAYNSVGIAVSSGSGTVHVSAADGPSG
jgi:hypothetical protein